MRRSHLQHRLTFTVVANAHGNGGGVAGDLHTMLRTHCADNATAPSAVMPSVEHGEYHRLAATTLPCLPYEQNSASGQVNAITTKNNGARLGNQGRSGRILSLKYEKMN